MAASDIAGLPEMVREGETGILMRPRDPEHIAERLGALLGDRELQARLSAGCAAAVPRYSREAHLDRLEEVFAQCRELGPKLTAPDVPGGGDPDLFTAMHAVLDKAKEVEDWANGMHGHLMHLEEQKKKGILGRLRG